MEEFRRHVGTVLPDEGVKDLVDSEALERVNIAQSLEYRAGQFAGEIHDAFAAVAAPEPDPMSGNVPRFHHVIVHGLLQGSQSNQRSSCPGKRPLLQEFLPVKRRPLEHEGARPQGEVPIHDATLDLDGDLEVSVDRVEVRGRMLPVEHADDDSQETANLRHDRRR